MSIIGDKIYSDFDYSFTLPDNYIYSQKVRATSNDEDLYVIDSGDIAVEVLANTAFSIMDKTMLELRKDIYNRSFCMLDISCCSKEEEKKTEEWCNDNDCIMQYVDDNKKQVIISDPFFAIGNPGIFMPGMDSWEKYDTIKYCDKEFFKNIPFGVVVDKQKFPTICMYDYSKDRAKESITSLSQFNNGEVIRQDERIIKLISYVKIKSSAFDRIFKIKAKDLKNDLEKIFNKNIIYYVKDDDFDEIILEIVPFYNMSTKQTIEIIEPKYKSFIKEIDPNLQKGHNTAYYIKYVLDRYLPEEIIK